MEARGALQLWLQLWLADLSTELIAARIRRPYGLWEAAAGACGGEGPPKQVANPGPLVDANGVMAQRAYSKQRMGPGIGRGDWRPGDSVSGPAAAQQRLQWPASDAAGVPPDPTAGRGRRGQGAGDAPVLHLFAHEAGWPRALLFAGPLCPSTGYLRGTARPGAGPPTGPAAVPASPDQRRPCPLPRRCPVNCGCPMSGAPGTVSNMA